MDNEADLNVEDDDHNGAQADAKDNGPDVVSDGLDVNYSLVNTFQHYEELIGEDTERANFQRNKKGKQVAEKAESGCGSGLDIDDASDDLKSLDGSNGEDDEGGQPMKFINIKYHEFHPNRDM
ncbi:hypothetical protein Q3G72_032926 [Acer saccharum]|nr:hypothetical protein Q3G72_032926 [Acer saccharum]